MPRHSPFSKWFCPKVHYNLKKTETKVFLAKYLLSNSMGEICSHISHFPAPCLTSLFSFSTQLRCHMQSTLTHCWCTHCSLYISHMLVDCTPACQNGGTCYGSSWNAYCHCPSGYSGSYCQYRGMDAFGHAVAP